MSPLQWPPLLISFMQFLIYLNNYWSSTLKCFCSKSSTCRGVKRGNKWIFEPLAMASTVFPFSFQHICQVLNPWCQHKGSSSNTHRCCCSQTPPVLVALPQIRCAVTVEWVWALNSLSLWPWWPWILFPLTNSFFNATVTPAHRLGFQWNWLWSLQKLSQKTMISVWGMHLHRLCFFSCFFTWLSCLVLIHHSQELEN